MPSDCLTCMGYLKSWRSFPPALKQPEGLKTMFFEKQGCGLELFFNHLLYK